MSDAYTYNRAILADIEHLAAHIESGADFTDHCDRILISDETFGLPWQIRRGIDWLADHKMIDPIEWDEMMSRVEAGNLS